MNAVKFRPGRDIRLPMEDLIQNHGIIRVTVELIRAAFRFRKSRPPPMRATDLSDHLRRDIGLGPCPPGSRDRDRF